MIHGTDEREPFKGYNVPRPHHALGDRPPLPEAIRGGSKVGPERCLVDLRPVSVAPPGLNLDDLGRLRGRPAATAARTGADPGGRAVPTRVTSKPPRYAEPRPHFPARTRTSTPSCSAPKTLRARNEAG